MPLAIVTTGPASEPIDDVRRITNFATGHIGAILAEALAREGFRVELFRGEGSTCREVPQGVALNEFRRNEDLARSLESLSDARGNEVLAVFQAAALSDFVLTEVRGPAHELLSDKKIPSDLNELHLTLKPAQKILPRLRAWFPNAWIVGWKYELDGSRDAALAAGRKQTETASDATIVNGAAYGEGFGFLEAGNPAAHFGDRRELAYFLASRAAESAKPHG